ncbi:hypothetical protein GUITHDRAFT_109359 [Guillardia theta CCMP2712]|uniref:VDE lipocalin domain-containing protein n=1 Tax=Guillardia theta (strain CCMP2712) TaxID=905079 RepID=L1J8Z5_GUITC|nr:hypothetical protein GUITHDRAFT_109359 [Guillardia theta CCMP2712]EKX44584.1 hypothetical protein GUITHDRAFT_109359 [Guillardia theta CCMP2712]|eukprot:XP_005831564.1 hypothetical protein GUITHDRAFT_109359 [Guillardia theta CCMP2712]
MLATPSKAQRCTWAPQLGDASHSTLGGSLLAKRSHGWNGFFGLKRLSGLLLVNTVFQPLAPSFAQDVNPVSSTSKAQGSCSSQHWSATLLASTEDTGGGFADLPPCLPWSSGPCVSVNGPCFADEKTGCGKSFKECAENKDCQKGLSCLARCKGEPTCSTGCFAAFADDSMTNFLGCALEDKECINFPKDPKLLGWLDDGAAAPKKVANFDINSLKGDWIKKKWDGRECDGHLLLQVLGLDDRYDCFECQQNRFREENGQWRMDTTFRLPRARGMSKDSNYLQNDLTEEVFVDSKDARPSMHTTGKTFGLTFWENYYIVGQGKDWQFVRYVGHTLQGGYKGAFVLSRTPELSASALEEVKAVATEQGLDLSGFCRIKNKACGTRQFD